MRSATAHKWHVLLLLLPLAGCGFFKDVKETGHEVKKVGEDVEKALNKMEQSDKNRSPTQQPPPAPPEHEAALLDNRVSALRVQEALRKAGGEFEKVRVEGSEHGVTLTGSVKREKDRVRAAEIARSLHRAMKLKNEIKVVE